MGRKRLEKDKWMPAKVYRGKSAYEYRPTKKVAIRLCALDAPQSLVIKRYAVEFERFNFGKGTLKELAELYFDSVKCNDLAARTQKDYKGYWEKIDPVFGKMDRNKVLPGHLSDYMEIKGKTSRVQANRHLALLKTLFKWGYNRGKINSNPALTIEKFSEKSRDRYIEDKEYYAVYNAAQTGVRVAMEISYLCAARQGDVLRLTKKQISDDGIYIKQGKTGKKQIKAWTPRLLAAIELAKTIQPKNGSIYVIPTRTGSPYTTSGFGTMWEKAQKAAREKTGMALDFTFHDLKAKSISDYEGDKQKFSGHKTASQVDVYDRKTAIVQTLNLPTIKKQGSTSD